MSVDEDDDQNDEVDDDHIWMIKIKG